VAVLLATGSVSAFVVYQKLNGNITQENVDNLIGGDRPTKVEVPDAPQEPLNILLLGSDERSGKAAENANVAGHRSHRVRSGSSCHRSRTNFSAGSVRFSNTRLPSTRA